MRLRPLLALAALVCSLLVVAPGAHAAKSLGSTAASPLSSAAASPLRVLFDDTKAETAGNADWIISTSMPDPTVQNASPTKESDWTGALSAWGVGLQKTGNYSLKTLSTGPITYGGSGALDLKNFDAFVLPEPNVLFTAAEKTAIMTFVKNGGGLFMISDHNGSDRNNDGADAVKILNDLMTNNSVDSSDPFGFSIDVKDIATDNPNVIGASAAGDPIIAGPFGTVTGTIIRDGTTATLKPADNSAVRGEVFTSGSSGSGTTNAAFVTSTFGSGRVAFWGDSSPIDDGTGQSGNTLYDGWDDPAGTDAAIALNATQWLAGGPSTGGGGTGGGTGGGGTGGGTGGGGGTGSALANGGFESGSAPWSLTGAIVVTSQAHSGTHSAHLGSATSTTDTLSQSFLVPSSGSLTWWTRMTTTETGTAAHDTLSVKLGSTTVKTFTNTGTKSTWTSSSASLAAYAGQTVTLTFTAVNDASSPTTFWVDDVSAG